MRFQLMRESWRTRAERLATQASVRYAGKRSVGYTKEGTYIRYLHQAAHR